MMYPIGELIVTGWEKLTIIVSMAICFTIQNCVITNNDFVKKVRRYIRNLQVFGLR